MDGGSKDVGLFISEALNTLGFNKDMVELRNRAHHGIKSYIDGTLRYSEIQTVIDENLCKVSLLKKNVICLSSSYTLPSRNEKTIVFESETKSTPPGFTRLVLGNDLSNLIRDEDILNSTFGMEKYLWSTSYSDNMQRNIGIIKVCQMLGPSISTGKSSFNFPLRYVDEELATQLLRKLYMWPVDGQALEESSIEGLVYPDSSSDSEYPHLEWSIRYTSAEQILFRSLNITQVKLYILLKMITRTTLQPISSEINSYILKNIVFWLIHIYPRDIFQEKYLIILLLTAIGMLYNCVKCDFIPCYLVENRNLLSRAMDVSRKYELLEMLAKLQTEKASMLLRCERLRCIMLMKFKSPHIIDIYQRQRDTLEQLLLKLSFIQATYAASAGTFEELKALVLADEHWGWAAVAVYDIVFPDWEEQYSRGVDVPDIVQRRIQEILS